MIVQPSQGAGPVFVHPEAHIGSSSRDPTLESPARAPARYPDRKTRLSASSKSRDVTTGRDVNNLRRRGLREPSADRISRRVGVMWLLMVIVLFGHFPFVLARCDSPGTIQQNWKFGCNTSVMYPGASEKPLASSFYYSFIRSSETCEIFTAWSFVLDARILRFGAFSLGRHPIKLY